MGVLAPRIERATERTQAKTTQIVRRGITSYRFAMRKLNTRLQPSRQNYFSAFENLSSVSRNNNQRNGNNSLMRVWLCSRETRREADYLGGSFSPGLPQAKA